jgi:hypothetical protein
VDRDEILRVLRAFEAVELDYVLIGATAMRIHGLIRATEDIDLFVKATGDNIERLRTALSAAYDAASRTACTAVDSYSVPATDSCVPIRPLTFSRVTLTAAVHLLGSANRQSRSPDCSSFVRCAPVDLSARPN